VGALCSAFLAYVMSNADEYRDQKKILRAELRRSERRLGGREAASITSPEVEEWLNGVQEDRELANATINKSLQVNAGLSRKKT
jgi:hypothetical protein